MFRRSLVVLSTAAVMFVAGAGASFAGPAGSGLASTEEHARRQYRERTLKVEPARSAAASACLSGLHADLKALPGVERVRVADGAVHVTFASKRHAAEQTPAVNEAARACERQVLAGGAS